MVDNKWYDTTFERAVHTPGGPVNYIKHLKHLSRFCVGSVLDLGCGLGLLADMIADNLYFGIDYSEYAIEHARKTTKNPRATFLHGDLLDFIETPLRYDTIVLSEVIEHIVFPAQLASFAVANYKKRLVGSVPVNMIIKSHIKPKWSRQEIQNLFGKDPIYFAQGCKNSKGRNIHWHFVYERK